MSSYTVAERNAITDPAVLAELDRVSAVTKALDAQLQSLGGNQGASDLSPLAAETGLITGKLVNTLPVDAAGKIDNTRRWLMGPWLLNADGNMPGDAVIRPPQILGNQDNYAPDGMDTCIGLELNGATDIIFSGLRTAAVQRRLIFILNTGLFNFIFQNESANSVAQNRIGLGAGSDTLTLPPGRIVWWYFDAWASRWRLFALPAVPSADLPASIQPIITPTAFPPAYGWFGSRVDGTSGVLGGVGEADTAIGGVYRNSTVGVGRDLTTAAAPGAAQGINTGGGAQVELQNDPTWDVLIRTGPAITNIRLWILLTNGIPTDADDLGGGTAYVGFRYSTVVPDAGWVGIMRDGAAQTVGGSPIALAVSTVYHLRMAKSGSAISFSVNGVALGGLTSPGGAFETSQLFWALRWFTQDGVAKTITFYQHSVKFGITF